MAEETLKKNGADYGEQNIITLEWYEHIRRRSGMYIGRLGNGERQGDGITSSRWASASASTSPSTRTRP